MKVLFIGLGSIGQRHCRNLRRKFGDHVDILAYRVRNLSQAITPTLEIEPDTDVNQQYGIRVYQDLSEALDEKPDVTFITNPTSLHLPMALKAAQAGSHLFIEKPLSHTWEGVDELISLCAIKGLVGYVAYQWRFHPGIELVGSLLSKNALGPLLSVDAQVGEYLPGLHKYEDYRQSYAARRELGGGVIFTQIHELDYLYSWFGLPQRIFCLGGKFSSLDINTEDTVKALMPMSYQGRPIPVSVHMDFIQDPPVRNCLLTGEKGRLALNLLTGIVTITHKNGQVTTHDFSPFERNTMFTKELDHFFDCIENKKKPLVSLADGANSLRMALAAHESLQSGSVVDLEKHADL